MRKEQKNRLYHDLAWLWPLWGNLEEYRPESEFITQCFQRHALIQSGSNLLDLGCGGGKNDFHFKKYFTLTGVDLSQEMLDLARKLNPECTYLNGDMRTIKLDQQFHAVYINDGIVYMSSRADLNRVFQTAYDHLLPGGVLITCAESLKETFVQNKTSLTTTEQDDLQITFIENQFDPDAEDDTFEMTFVYLIRKQGVLSVEQDFHTGGLFSLDFWKQSLVDIGFQITLDTLKDNNDEFTLLICVKPEIEMHTAQS